MADAQGDGWRVPSGDFLLDIWGVRDTTHRAVVRQDLSDFSLVCFRQILDLPDGHGRKKPRGYIAAGLRNDYPSRAVFEPFVDEAWREGWLLRRIPAGIGALSLGR
jgi:hypothetical protein